MPRKYFVVILDDTRHVVSSKYKITTSRDDDGPISIKQIKHK